MKPEDISGNQMSIREPVLNHRILHELYHTDLNIEPDTVAKFLALPRQTLITDLEALLLDSIGKYDVLAAREYDDRETAFPIHAIFLLTELEATDSLQHLLEFLKQEEELIEFYLGDYLSELIWESILTLGSGKLDLLQSFVCDSKNYTYARSAVSQAVSQLALHDPSRRSEVVEWYREVLNYYMKNMWDDDVYDPTLVGFIIGDILDFQGIELRDVVKELYVLQAVDQFVSGPWRDVAREFDNPPQHDMKTPLHSLTEKYNYFRDIKPSHNRDRKFANLTTYKRDKPKVGRNDPCPCGSGKKYKRCCIHA